MHGGRNPEAPPNRKAGGKVRRLISVWFAAAALLQTAALAEETYSWQKPHAKVLDTGELQWAPEEFVFEKGDSVRYIDYENGNDGNAGLARRTPWKHHPWDKLAGGAAKECKGIHTYVFKGGVAYRGALKATESGEPGNPIRLTRDPAWGRGEASFYGSTQIKGGWKKAAARDAPGIPRPDRVWYIDLGRGYDPDEGLSSFSAIWQVDGDKVERLHIARTPNYDLSDPNNPLKNWPTWSRIDGGTSTYHSPVIRELNRTSGEELNDVVVWCTAPSLMGSAYPRNMRGSTWNINAGSVKTRAFGNAGNFARHRAWNHFMIENAAVLLDSPGEYFFARRGPSAGRLYLRPAGDIDPNTVQYEVAQTHMFITIIDQSNIVISGLEFRHNDPDNSSAKDNTRHNTKPAPCILVVGNCSDITIRNNSFYYVADAIEVRLRRVGRGGSRGQVLDNIIISDNDVRDASGAGVIGILGADFHGIHPKDTVYGRLRHVEVKRNRLVNTGFRGSNARWDSLPAICVLYPETCEIAGNIVKNSFGIGIITFGGKSSGHRNRTVPLIRYLIHHNQLENTMFGCNDYGGLEHFQGGPTYLYNNVSRNTVGNRSFWNQQLGYNLYLDGGFKCYSFNNILAGDVRPDQPDYFGHCGYFMVFGFMDQFFNNTIYHFVNGMDGSSGNRSNIVGNLVVDCENAFIRQNRPGDVSMMGGGDTGEMGRMGIPTMAYSSNVFHGSPKIFGEVAGTSNKGAGGGKAPVVKGSTLGALRAELEKQKCRLGGLGWQVTENPLVDPAKKDYRPAADSGAGDRGVKYFVPWSLARNVGEWNFYRSASTPNVVLGEGYYMTDEYINRGMYYFIPRNDLNVSTCSAEDYVKGSLEDWIEGALVFDGKRIASLSHAEMTKSMEYPVGRNKIRYDGSKRETVDMAANNFLIEVFFKTGAGHTGGVLASKSDRSSGYELAIGSNGAPCLTIKSNGSKATAVSAVKVNDGKWHHVIAEVDRAAGKAALYVDGRAAGEGKLDAVAKDAALSNTADFLVGKGLTGAVDFLRVCRSTLAESKTTIDELYTWEFDGPFLSDFTGRTSSMGKKRDAGAIQGAGWRRHARIKKSPKAGPAKPAARRRRPVKPVARRPRPAEQKPAPLAADPAVMKLYQEAETALIDGELGGAKALFEKLLKEHPDSALAPKAKEYLGMLE